MNPGFLRKKIEFYNPVSGFDESGAPEGSYEPNPAFSAWARYSGEGSVDNDGFFEIRYRNDVKRDHKIVDVETGNEYRVVDVYDPDGRRRRLHVVFKEVAR